MWQDICNSILVKLFASPDFAHFLSAEAFSEGGLCVPCLPAGRFVVKGFRISDKTATFAGVSYQQLKTENEKALHNDIIVSHSNTGLRAGSRCRH